MAQILNSIPALPPLNGDQAELIVLTKAPPAGCFLVPVGHGMQPTMVQAAFERLLMNDCLRLVDVNLHPVQVVINKTELAPCRIFKLTEDGVRRLAVLRGTAKLDS